MKKVLLLIIGLFMLTGCSSNKIEELSYKELNKKFDNKETFILYFDGTDGDVLEDTLNRVLEKENLVAYTINTSKLSQDEITTLRYKVDFEEPSIVFIKEGNDPSILTHITDIYITDESLTTRLTALGFIENKNLNE